MTSKNTISRSIALVSGGLATASLLDYCESHFNVTTPVYVRSGFRWEDAELFWIKKILRHKKREGVESLEVIELPLRDLYQFHWSVTGVKVPQGDSKKYERTIAGRELLMLGKVAVMATLRENPVIIYGRHISSSSGGFEIPSKDLLKITQDYLGQAAEVRMPFIELSAEQLISGQGPEATYFFSCLNPRGMAHCGECFKCFGRKMNVFKAGVLDKTLYARQDSLLEV